MTEQMVGQATWLDQGMEFGRMFREHCPRRERDTQEKTSKKSSRSSSVSQSQMLPLCLCLKSGARADSSMMSWEDGALLGESQIVSGGEFHKDENGLLWLPTSTDFLPDRFYLTLNIGERPREENPTKLSEVLQDFTDPKYNLSSKACKGILNRAERRGKPLPEVLKQALENQIDS